MTNLSANHHFYKSFKNLLQGKLTAREVLIYGIILSFNNTKGCFISRAEFAARINESEATAERSIQLLISEGYVKANRQGRKRYLVITDLYQPDTSQVTDLYQNENESVSKQGSDLYQVNTLVRSNTKIPIVRSNIKIQDLYQDDTDSKSIGLNFNSTNQGKTKLVWSAEKNAMVRIRC